MHQKKLSILIYSLAGGGAERVASILLWELKEKYDITLVLMRSKIDYEIPKEIKIHLLEDSDPLESGIKKLLKLPLLGLRYKNFCQKHGIDVSLALMNRPSYVAVFSKIFGNRIRHIISERTTPSMMYRHHNMLSKVNKILIKNFYPKADLIIANAEGNRIDLVDHFGITSSRVVTIPNPFDLEKIDRLSKEPVETINFDRFTFVTVGRLDEGKNHRLLIDAFSSMDCYESQLIILGEGDQRSSLERQIEDLGLKNRVFLMGFDNNPYKYFSKADLFVFSSKYEGFPNVLMEALACGLPVVSTDCKSGPREILAPNLNLREQVKRGVVWGEYGVLTPVDDQEALMEAMDILYKDSVTRENYSNRAQKRAKYFDKGVIVHRFIEVIEGRLI